MNLAIISGKGGTGKSSVSAAFISLAQPVMAVDCDVDAANLYLIYDPITEQTEDYISGYHPVIDKNVCLNCGKCVRNCHFNALSLTDDGVELDNIACEGCNLCFRLCPVGAISMAPSEKSYLYFGPFRSGYMSRARLTPGEDNSGKLISLLREKADKLAEKKGYSLSILDGPPGIGCPVISTLTGVDEVVIVTEPTQSGISDMKRVYEVALQFTKEISIIVNKYDLDIHYTEEIAVWCKEQKIPLLAKMPFDRKMIEAVLNKQSIIEYAPDSSCSMALGEAFSNLQCVKKIKNKQITKERIMPRRDGTGPLGDSVTMGRREMSCNESTVEKSTQANNPQQFFGRGRGQDQQGFSRGMGRGRSQNSGNRCGRGQNKGLGRRGGGGGRSI